MNKKFLKHYMETNPEGTAQTYIFLVDNQDIALNIVMSGYQALCLVQEDDGYYFSVDSFIEEMRSIQFTGSCQSAYHYVAACTVKWMNDKLQTFFKDAGLDGKAGWQLFKEKEYLGKLDNQKEVEKLLEQYILRFEREPKEQPELSRFHLFDAKGNVKGVRDMEIVDYLVENVQFFVVGITPYYYEHGAYWEEHNGVRMKYRIQKLIYRDQIQSGVIKRIYNLLITQPKVHREAYELNKQPVRWINFKNGYYDPITGEMLEHNPDYLTINQIPFPYYPEDREQVMQGGENIKKYLASSLPNIEEQQTLSNSAALCERPKAYLVWGVDDATHKIVGTEFQYRKMKKGNEELEAWLSRMLSPRINFRFFEVPMDEGMVVLMEIPCAEKQPVQFAGGEYIRIGTNKKNLKEYPDKERELWRTFDSTPYELRIAMGNLNEDEMVSLLDYSKYYDKLEMPIPRNRDKVLEDLQHEKFIMKNDAGTWDITNMGALMIAKDLKKFESLHRRSVRVIWYKENSRLDAIREKEFCAGYAFSHEEIVQYIMTIIPQEEVIVEATRKSVVSFPEIAIRELLANAMIHQDLQQRGTNPMVEVFKNRIEFSNAGAPLVAIERIVDSVPVSRNENIAGFMHKCGICEERGSGYDKIVEATGKNELLAPRIENQNNQFTKAILFAKVPFELTTKEDRMRTCYMQACLAYVNFEGISNSDIRKIFGLGEKEKAKASRLLTSAVEGGYIKVMDPDTAPRYKKYIPYWA